MDARRLCGLAAVAGVVVAHTIAYVVMFPAAGRRTSVLDASGHSSWHLVSLVAVAAAVAAAFAAVARGVTAGRRACDAMVPRTIGLGLTQMALFVGLEVVERMATGASPT